MSGVTDSLQTVTDRHGQATDTLWTHHGHATDKHYGRITDKIDYGRITDALRTLRTHYGHVPDCARIGRKLRFEPVLKMRRFVVHFFM